MRTLFPGYFRLTEEEFKDLWKHGIFVFDANVLLRLYSYPEDLRKTFFDVLDKIKNRIWIPYHVALEFNRNRLIVIKQTRSAIEEIIDSLSKTKTSLLERIQKLELDKRSSHTKNIKRHIDNARKSIDKLADSVKKSSESLPTLCLEDDITKKVCTIFNGKIGSPPQNQEELNAILFDAELRYTSSIPPGFGDNKKDDVFYDRSIKYESKYGDLIIWKQIIEHALQKKIKKIVFITGDKKKDWWWNEEGKTIGPLPALCHEMHATAELDMFWMYNIEQFLTHSKDHLTNTPVTDETLTNIKNIEIKISAIDTDKLKNVPPPDIIYKSCDILSEPWNRKLYERTPIHYPVSISRLKRLAQTKDIDEDYILSLLSWLTHTFKADSATINSDGFIAITNKTTTILFNIAKCSSDNPSAIDRTISNNIAHYQRAIFPELQTHKYGLIVLLEETINKKALAFITSSFEDFRPDGSPESYLIIGTFKYGFFQNFYCNFYIDDE